MLRQAVRQYRALSFGQPIGPWRYSLEKARADLIGKGLGSYDEWGAFFVTVPGDMDRRYALEEIEDAA